MKNSVLDLGIVGLIRSISNGNISLYCPPSHAIIYRIAGNFSGEKLSRSEATFRDSYFQIQSNLQRESPVYNVVHGCNGMGVLLQITLQITFEPDS